MALGQVDSGAKMAAFAGRDQRANGRVAFDRGQRGFELGEHLVVDGVALLGPRQPDRGVITGALDFDEIHRSISSRATQRGRPKMRSATRLRWMSWVPP